MESLTHVSLHDWFWQKLVAYLDFYCHPSAVLVCDEPVASSRPSLIVAVGMFVRKECLLCSWGCWGAWRTFHFMTGSGRYLWFIKTWIVISVQVLICDQAVASALVICVHSPGGAFWNVHAFDVEDPRSLILLSARWICDCVVVCCLCSCIKMVTKEVSRRQKKIDSALRIELLSHHLLFEVLVVDVDDYQLLVSKRSCLC